MIFTFIRPVLRFVATLGHVIIVNIWRKESFEEISSQATALSILGVGTNWRHGFPSSDYASDYTAAYFARRWLEATQSHPSYDLQISAKCRCSVCAGLERELG